MAQLVHLVPFVAVVEAVVSRAYYRDDRVLGSLGVEARPPFPKGYAVEKGDGWEGPVGTGAKKWNLYAVTDARGQVLTAYMADDPKLKNVAGLPTKKTDDLPEYFWKPRLQAIDDVLAGRRNASVENDRHGAL